MINPPQFEVRQGGQPEEKSLPQSYSSKNRTREYKGIAWIAKLYLTA